MKRIGLFGLLSALILLSCIICGQGQYSVPQSGYSSVAPVNGAIQNSASQSVKTIEIKDLSFQPASITVPSGTIVEWMNHDPMNHTVTSNDGKFDSGIIKPGGDFKFTFSQSGTYSYHCKIHPSMTGKVMVTSAQPAKTMKAVPNKQNIASIPTVAQMSQGQQPVKTMQAVSKQNMTSMPRVAQMSQSKGQYSTPTGYSTSAPVTTSPNNDYSQYYPMGTDRLLAIM